MLKKQPAGFTIVELLIVIVVIAILAAISIVAYNGIQVRARDAQRATDASSILKALEAYKAINNVYPTATSTVGSGSWEQSTETPGTYMEYLQSTFSTKIPVDPLNDGSHMYRYYRYPESWLSSVGCPTNRGALMIFFVIGYEQSSNMPQSDPSLVCTGASWGGNATNYFKYKFENG